jgi:hypothetical protein
VPFPVDHVPPGTALEVGDVIGRVLVSPLDTGEVVTSTRLLISGPREDGLLTVPVRLVDAETADLLSPGSVIDLIRPTGQGGDVLAAGALVVTVPRRPTERGFAASPRPGAGSLVVVATDRRTAVALAAAGSSGGLGVIIR